MRPNARARMHLKQTVANTREWNAREETMGS